MFNLLASAASSANPKQAAMEAAAPNAVFEPNTMLIWLTAGFFVLACFMGWLIIRAGKGYDYNS